VAKRLSFEDGYPFILKFLWDISCLYLIRWILQDYIPLANVFGYFWLKLHNTDNYRTFRSAWHYEIIYTYISCKFITKSTAK